MTPRTDGLVASMPSEAETDIPPEQIINRLRIIGHGNPSRAYRWLCAMAELCHLCGLPVFHPEAPRQCGCRQ